MKLSMLSIEGNKEYEKSNNIIPINILTYYVTELFMHFLNRIDLDGSSKLVIHFYERLENESKYVCDRFFHVSTYNVDKATITKFDTIRENETGEFFLDIIVEACKYIAEFNNKKELIEMIGQAADKVREYRFELMHLQKKLSKSSADKKYKANVYRYINHLGEMWYVEIENKSNKTSARYEIMKQYAHISKTEYFKKSYWKDGKFVLTDRFDRVVEIIRTDICIPVIGDEWQE